MKTQQLQLAYTILTLFLATTSTLHAVQQYEVIDLGENLYPACFNDNGQVVLQDNISYNNFDEITNLYLWDNGITEHIYSTNDMFTRAKINNSSVIAARLTDYYGRVQYSLVFDGDHINSISEVFLRDINDSGQIIQQSLHPTNDEMQTHLRNPDGSLLDCGNTTDTFTFGIAVNSFGQVAGATGSDYDHFSGFVWDPVSGKRYLAPLDGDIGASGMDINTYGQVVGYSATSMDTSSPEDWDWNLVFWDSDGTIHDLGRKLYQFNQPVCLNDLGQVVVDLKLPGAFNYSPYYWDVETGFIDAQDLLDEDSPWTITDLISINNQGQIIGIADDHAVLLNPIPEPTTVSLMLGLIWMNQRKAKNH